MKTKYGIGSATIFFLLGACVASEGDDPTFDIESVEAASEDELTSEQIDDQDFDDEDIVEVDEAVIATIYRDGGEVVFYVDVNGPAAGEVTMDEKFFPDEEGMLTVPTEHLTPLETFLELTDASAPVPRALLESEPEVAQQLATERAVVDSIDEPLRAAIGDLTSKIPTQKWSAAFMCSEGGTSGQFLHEICSIDSWWDQTVCHNGTWHDVTDYSNNWVNWTRGRTLACGANGRTRHQYRFGGIWYQNHNVWVSPGTLIYSTKTPITKLPRRVRHNRTGSGFVRGASQFHRFPS